jgi:hypothetical protein
MTHQRDLFAMVFRCLAGIAGIISLVAISPARASLPATPDDPGRDVFSIATFDIGNGRKVIIDGMSILFAGDSSRAFIMTDVTSIVEHVSGGARGLGDGKAPVTRVRMAGGTPRFWTVDETPTGAIFGLACLALFGLHHHGLARRRARSGASEASQGQAIMASAVTVPAAQSFAGGAGGGPVEESELALIAHRVRSFFATFPRVRDDETRSLGDQPAEDYSKPAMRAQADH